MAARKPPSEDLLMIVTIFRSRLNPGVLEEYGPMASAMSELAKGSPATYRTRDLLPKTANA